MTIEESLDRVDQLETGGQLAQALDLLVHAVQLHPRSPRLQTRLVEIAVKRVEELVQAQELNPALELLEEILEKIVQHPALHYQRGVISFALEDYERALEAFQDTLNADLKTAEVYTSIAGTQLSLKKLDAARKSINKALKLNPRDLKAYENLAQIHDTRDNLDEALETYDRALTRVIPDHRDEVHFLKGVRLLFHGLFDQAAASFQQALELDPDNPLYHYNLGFAFYYMDDLDRATRHFRKFHRNEEFAAFYTFHNSSLLFENARRLQEARRQQQISQKTGLVGQSPVWRKVVDTISIVAPQNVNVLLLGESGTGKTHIARAIHEQSGRRGVFVEVNCSAIPLELTESELFGHVRGAFTDAHHEKEGLFEQARGGTLFLDEISEMHPLAQTKILQAIETRQIRRVGATEPTPLDIRLIAATNRPLDRLLQDGHLRQDLYYRLNQISIEVPPLRRRSADALLLADLFLRQACRAKPIHQLCFSPAVKQVIQTYSWPGNVRELENIVGRAVILFTSERRTIETGDFDPAVVQAATGPSPERKTAGAVSTAPPASAAGDVPDQPAPERPTQPAEPTDTPRTAEFPPIAPAAAPGEPASSGAHTGESTSTESPDTPRTAETPPAADPGKPASEPEEPAASTTPPADREPTDEDEVDECFDLDELLNTPLRKLTREQLKALLEADFWNIKQTAKRIGVRRETLQRRYKKLGLINPRTNPS